MKKIIVVFFCLIFSSTGFAQKAKIGHVDYGSVLKEVPGIDTAQTNLLSYQRELEETGQKMVEEFKSKQMSYAQMANSGSSSAILKVKEDELQKLYQRIQEFASISEQELQEKQLALLQPFTDKLVAAIKKVAEKNGYTYVFDISTLAFYADSDNLTEAVKKELGITK